MTLEQQEKYSSFAIRFERDDEAGVWIARLSPGIADQNCNGFA